MRRITVILSIFFVIIFYSELSAQQTPMPTQLKAKPTIAVTTFEHLSAYPENAWVAMSFSEALTVKLKRQVNHLRACASKYL